MGKMQRAGYGAGAFGAMAAVAVLAAPSASAVINNVVVASTNPVVGCSYLVTANTSLLGSVFTVTFLDNGVEFGKSSVVLAANQATINWTPKSAGKHTITAKQELISSQSVDVNVSEQSIVSKLLGTGSASCTSQSSLSAQ
ncbi:hypothetical protein ACQP06_23305 [Nocardia sp. CA-136227]|uniref:hypothetical protein n=1 Tax=Nocardia sp. CA-136227 TaxID=3239979 RepID=UPI003D983A12